MSCVVAKSIQLKLCQLIKALGRGQGREKGRAKSQRQLISIIPIGSLVTCLEILKPNREYDVQLSIDTWFYLHSARDAPDEAGWKSIEMEHFTEPTDAFSLTKAQ